MKEIELTQGQIAIVDDEDYEYLSHWKWCAAFDPSYKKFRAQTADYSQKLIGKKTVLMHRLVMKAKSGDIIDHANGNTLDNRKENLRLASSSENSMNRRKCNSARSIYKGVRYRYSKNRKKHWGAIITKNGVRFGLGFFLTEKEAARAYDEKAKELFGEFAKLNFTEGESCSTLNQS